MGNWFTDLLDDAGDAIGTAQDWVRRWDPLAGTPFGTEPIVNFGGDDAGVDLNPTRRTDGREIPLGGPIGQRVGQVGLQTVERFSAAYEYVYGNYISQPLSTGILMAQRPGQILSADEWSRTWTAAQYIAPGQAAQLPFAEEGLAAQLSQINPIVRLGANFGIFGDTGNAQAAVDSPLRRFAPPGIENTPGWSEMSEEERQQLLADMDMPVDPMGGNAFIADLRDRSMGYRYFSGMGDFALRWYADPITAGLRGIGAARRHVTTASRPQGGWSAGDIDRLVNDNRTQRLIRFLDENRTNPALINNTDMAIRSSMGPRLGAINEVLRNADEVRDFIRVGMGDVAAQERLAQSNALARQRLDGYRTRLDMQSAFLAMQYRGPGAAQMRALAQRQIDNLNAAIEADEAMVRSYSSILEHADEIDRLYLPRWQYTARMQEAAARNRTEAQRSYITGPARDRRAGREFRARITPAVAPVGTSIPVQSGIVKTRLWGLGDAFTTPVTVIRMMKNAKPRGHMDLDNGQAFSAENITELRAQLARIPAQTDGWRQHQVNLYLRTASEGERRLFLEQLGAVAMGKISEKYGLDAKAGLELWEEARVRRTGEADRINRYSAAEMQRPGQPSLPVDAFQDGNAIRIHPHTVSRLQNGHILDDLDIFDRMVRRNASKFRALRQAAGGTRDWVDKSGDILNQYWKFATLFRLGYIPRTIGDDIASQWAALGTAAMAMRVGYGTRNLITNAVHRSRRGLDEAEARMQQQGLDYARKELGLLERESRRLQGAQQAESRSIQQGLTRATGNLARARQRLAGLPSTATPAQQAATQRFVLLREQQLRAAQARQAKPLSPRRSARIGQLTPQIAQLRAFEGLAQRRIDELTTRNEIVRQGTQGVRIGDQVLPAAFGGQRGEYYAQRISPSQAYDQLFLRNRQLIHANLMRSWDNGARPISAVDDEAKHATAWAHAINAQIAGDVMERMVVAGRSDAEIVRWLTRDPAGRDYWRRLGVGQISTPEDIVQRARAEVDEYLPLPEIRAQALTEEGVTPAFLQDAVQNPLARPTVHMANVGRAGVEQFRGMDRIMQMWYQVAVNLPAKTLSRHPLYNQLYEGHLKSVVSQRARQGAQTRTVEEVDRAVEASRRLAERDMKRLVFDISHQSDAAAALRFISPFFSATAESFQRWARIIAEKPEVVGYAAKFYNAPAYLGHLQTQDGDQIFPDGTFIDPNTGERRLADKANRFIVGRMPEWLIDSPVGVAMGVERTSGNFMLSQNSINLVTQGDPWFNPGFGPVVAIPVGEFVKDKPRDAELARELGILPFGPPTGGNPIARATQSAAPGTIRNFLTALDTSDYRYQQVKMQIMQRAIYEHEQNGVPMLSAQEIADRARNYWLWSGVTAFVQPAATRRKDAFEFFRQQYRNMQRENPETADVRFLERFGEEYFIFAQSMSRNEAGIQATQRAVELSQQYADILSENPELGPLIIGSEGNGPFSPEAYAYQLNQPLEPGDPESQRRRLSASEAIEENNRRLGWARYTQFVNALNAQAVQRGLNGVGDEGAEDLEQQRRAFVAMLGEPMVDLGDGDGMVANPHYNEQWSEDWFSFDARRYERLIPALDRVSAEILERDPDRTDLRTLRTYLAARQSIQQELSAREFSTLGAQANSDLRRVWTSFVSTLTEADTTFGDLWSRYLSRDLGVDVAEEATVMEREEAVI